MIFSKLASLGAMVSWCRSLRQGLAAGLDTPRIFDMQAKNGPRELREAGRDIAEKLRGGETFQDAMAAHAYRFPPLFNDLLSVGEETGHLPEMFGELEKYFALRQTMLRDFRAAITMPVIQFFAAIFIISGLIFILGMIGESSNTKPIAVFGLSGTGGALTFLLGAFSIIGLLWVGFIVVRNDYNLRAKIESILLRIPKLGSCLRSFAMNRFCTAFYLTMGAGMSVLKALELSLRASGNAHFDKAYPGIKHSIKTGHDLNESLTMSRVFEDRFLHILEVSETSGRITESMKQQAEQYAEEAEFQWKALTKFAGLAVWGFVALFIIICIFQVASIYLGILNSGLNQI